MPPPQARLPSDFRALGGRAGRRAQGRGPPAGTVRPRAGLSRSRSPQGPCAFDPQGLRAPPHGAGTRVGSPAGGRPSLPLVQGGSWAQPPPSSGHPRAGQALDGKASPCPSHRCGRGGVGAVTPVLRLPRNRCPLPRRDPAGLNLCLISWFLSANLTPLRDLGAGLGSSMQGACPGFARGCTTTCGGWELHGHPLPRTISSKFQTLKMQPPRGLCVDVAYQPVGDSHLAIPTRPGDPPSRPRSLR